MALLFSGPPARMLVLLFFLFLKPCASQEATGQLDYCIPGTRIPNVPPRSCLNSPNGTLATCHSACNKATNRLPCRCDVFCNIYKDCCPDMTTRCPHSFIKGQQMVKERIQVKLDCMQFLFLNTRSTQRKSYTETVSLIASCQNGDHCIKTSAEDVLHPNLAIPITDQQTGLHYVNFHCARCNTVSKMKWWSPRLECDALANGGSPVIMDEVSLKQKLTQCILHYLEPVGKGSSATRFGCRSHGLIDANTIHATCPSTCKNRYLVHKCENSVTTDYFQHGSQLFVNYYCVMCASSVNLQDVKCFQPPGSVDVVSVKDYSLGVLYEFDHETGLHLGIQRCPSGQHKVNVANQSCKVDVCPIDFSLLGDECVPISHRGIISIKLYFAEPQDLVRAFLQFKASNFVKVTLAKQIKHAHTKDASSYNERGAHIDAKIITLNILNITMTYLYYNSSGSAQLFETLQIEIKAPLEEGVLEWLAILNITPPRVSIHTETVLVTENLSIDDCKWMSLPTESFQILNNSVILIESQKAFLKERFRVVRDKVFVCMEPELEMSSGGFKYQTEIAVTLIVVICVGLFYMGIRVVRHFKNSFYKDWTPMS